MHIIHSSYDNNYAVGLDYRAVQKKDCPILILGIIVVNFEGAVGNITRIMLQIYYRVQQWKKF